MCDMGRDETVEYVVPDYRRYVINRKIRTKLRHNRNERIERTGREWIIILLGLC